MTKRRKAIIVRLLLLAVFWLSSCTLLSPPINVSGLWVGNIQWTDGPGAGFTSPISLDLVHVDKDLSGTVRLVGPASLSYDLTISHGRTRTASMSLDASGTLPTNPPQNVTIDLDGDLLETQMSGTGTQTINGSTYHLTWEVVLVAPAIPEE